MRLDENKGIKCMPKKRPGRCRAGPEAMIIPKGMIRLQEEMRGFAARWGSGKKGLLPNPSNSQHPQEAGSEQQDCRGKGHGVHLVAAKAGEIV